jgi:hypothetical protein
MSSENDFPAPTPGKRARVAAFWEAFKNVAILFSFIVNIVLVITLLIVAGWIIFPAKTDIVEPMLDNLKGAVNALDNATIERTIPIDQQVPVSFTLPLKQPTTVVLAQDVPLMRPATFYLPANGGSINGTVVLNLPTGLQLPILLDLNVPVQNSIPVRFPVEVTIPLRETELSLMVVELNRVVDPIRKLLDDLPDGF